MLARRNVLRFLCLSALFLSTTWAWEWGDFLGNSESVSFRTTTLSMAEVAEMRVRDLKRRLSRRHGYSADELGRMLDKKELIQALAFEEHKERLKEQEALQRFLLIRGIMVACAAVILVIFWPLISQAWEVASVNLVVYLDRKKYEAQRCIELRSTTAVIGVLLMAILDVLQTWLSVSVLLSWVMSSKYFFPTPSMPVRPADFMGQKVSSGPLGKYGINVGPMCITWVMRFVHGRLEGWTGKQLQRAQNKQRQATKAAETPEERAARKAAKRAAKEAAKRQREEHMAQERAKELMRRRQEADKATDALFGTPRMASEQDEQTKRKAAQDDFQRQVEETTMEDLD